MDREHAHLEPHGVETSHPQRWQRTLHYLVYLAYIAAALLPPIIRYIAQHLFPKNYWAFSAYATQVAVLLVLLVFAALRDPVPKAFDAKTFHDRRAEKAAVEFKAPWVGLWIAWFLFYLFLAAHELLGATQKPAGVSPYWDPLLNLLNNLQTVCLLLCYVTLFFPTLEDAPARRTEVSPGWRLLRSSSRFHHGEASYTPLAFRFVVLMAVTALVTIGNYLYVMMKAPIPDTRHDLGCEIFRLISGAALGIALALLVGQLQSRDFRVPSIWIAALYFYAVIQFSYTDFGGQEATSERIFTTISLPLKVLLFYIVNDAQTSGRLVYYMKHAQALYKEAKSKWEEFESSHLRSSDEEAASAAGP